MSEEIKKCEEEKCCCVCKLIKCETCKKFLIVAVGTFVGGFCALSLFAALHKPPMMHPGMHRPFHNDFPRMERPFKHHHHHFYKGEFKKFPAPQMMEKESKSEINN